MRDMIVVRLAGNFADYLYQHRDGSAPTGNAVDKSASAPREMPAAFQCRVKRTLAKTYEGSGSDGASSSQIVAIVDPEIDFDGVYRLLLEAHRQLFNIGSNPEDSSTSDA